MSGNRAGDRVRWFVLSVFLLSSAINYLDRQTLATLGPLLRAEFHLTTREFGWVIGIFSIAYAVAAPFAGALIDRFGLNLSSSLAVGLWSVAGIATGFTRGLASMIACRTVLGVAESAGIPAAGKAIDSFLHPSQRALGNALNQAGVSIGLIAAPPLAIWIASHYGWRHAFAVTGAMGLLWIPIWNFTSRLLPQVPRAKNEAAGGPSPLRDPRLWAFVVANALTMFGYSLWTNWSSFYFVDVHHMPLEAASRYVLAVFTLAAAGGFVGGWLSARLIAHGAVPQAARLKVCLAGAALSLFTAAIPATQTPFRAAAGIALSFFAVSAMSVNVYSLPLDTFGRDRAAFGIAALVSSYGAMQLVVSPIIGGMIDAHRWTPLIFAATITPALACAVLYAVLYSGRQRA